MENNVNFNLESSFSIKLKGEKLQTPEGLWLLLFNGKSIFPPGYKTHFCSPPWWFGILYN
jgi:hypothetical protein